MSNKLLTIGLLIIGVIAGITLDRAWHGPSKATTTGDITVKAHNDEDKETANQSRGTADEIVNAPAGGFNPQYVHSEQVSIGTVPELIPVSGKLAFDAERSHLASARVSGRLDEILVFEGARVIKGQPLAKLYSPDYISSQNEYLLARNTVRTFQEAGNADLLNDAEATEQSAINKLHVLGASDEDIEQLAKAGVSSPHLIIRAPLSGVVSKRNMDAGAFLNVGDSLMSIVDTSILWFYGNVYEQDYSKVRLGQELQLKSAALPGKKFKGHVSFIAPSIDPVTHALSVRCDIPNPAGDLRPELFVTANLIVSARKAVIVPNSVLLHIKDENYVITDAGNGLYRRIAVTANNLEDGRVAVFSGLTGTDRVVSKGAVLVNDMISD
jgi:membrane fusion protein, copper/silver efflux system